MQTKTCTTCRNEKPITEFYKLKHGLFGVHSACKVCFASRASKYYQKCKDKLIEYSRIYRTTNPEKVKIAQKQWEQANSERRKASLKKWKLSNLEYEKKWRQANPKKVRATMKRFRQNHPEKIKMWQNEWQKQKRKTDIKFKLNCNIKTSICDSLQGNKMGRHWEIIVGYTLNELKNHLEKYFANGMTWENYGPAWHIDHSVPISVFNFTKPEHRDFKRCWALSNLQPMWAKDNISKSNKLTKHFQPSLLME